jgi:hypothetical protein
VWPSTKPEQVWVRVGTVPDTIIVFGSAEQATFTFVTVIEAGTALIE